MSGLPDPPTEKLGGVPRRWARLLAEAAIDLDTADRSRFLEAVLAGDAGLRREVEELLAADDSASDFLDSPALGAPPGSATAWGPEPEELLQRGTLGPFRLLRFLGSGGMGVVFLARREGHDQHLALKVARAGHLLRHRLEAEGEILHRLRHPAIAAVLDVGTAEGLPYVAMEFVEGSPIDQPLAGAPWRRVVEVMLEVCHGVEYAHRNLVLHRDLKPANILLTTGGSPKLVDFGVAKLLAESGQVPAASTVTRLGGSPATPGYASPEQLRGAAVATTGDVYSLGVVLYKLLCGALPRDIRSLEPRELERAFAATPAAPSVVLETATGSAADRWGSRAFAADLDAVVLKALRPEPEARYGSAAELAEDLRRCLAGLPVAARRWTPVYRASSFLRRHRKVAAAAALLLVFGSVMAVRESMQAARLAEERDHAVLEQHRANQVTEFVTTLLQKVDPDKDGKTATTVDELLAQGTDELARREDLSPEVREQLLETLGETNLQRRRLGDALDQLSKVLELRRARLPADAPEVDHAIRQTAQAALGLVQLPLAEKLTRESLAIQQRSKTPDLEIIAQNLSSLSGIYALRFEPARAERAAKKAIEAWRRVPRDTQGEQLALDLSRTMVLRLQGRYTEAIAIQRRNLAVLRAAPQVPRLLLAQHVDVLALALISSAGDLDEAESLIEEALELRSGVLGGRDAMTGMTLSRRGLLDLARGDLEMARERLEKALQLGRASTDLEAVTIMQFYLGSALRRLGELDAAERSLEEAFHLMDGALPPNHPYRVLPTIELVEIALARDDLDAARVWLERGRGPCERSEPLFLCSHLAAVEGRWLIARGETSKGRARLRQGIDQLSAVLGPEHPRVAAAKDGHWPARGGASPVSDPSAPTVAASSHAPSDRVGPLAAPR